MSQFSWSTKVPRFRWLAFIAVFSACSSSPTGTSNYAVAYELTVTGAMTFDSVKYDDGHGNLIKVNTPANGWLVSVSVASGGSIEAHAWGVAVAGGQTAKLKVTWTLSGVSTASDSSLAPVSAPGAFFLNVAKRQI
jgi:hypothetical protein